MGDAGRRRVLVLVSGALGERLIGPEIRAWEFAKALSADYQVTVGANRSTDEQREGVRVIAASRRRLLREAAEHDVVLSACIPPYLFALRKQHGPPMISDLYDPHEQELATLAPGRQRARRMRVHAAIETLQLRQADVVICASDRQRETLMRRAAEVATARTPPRDVEVVPFGVPDPPPRSGRRPLHDHFPALRDDDRLVLWWGSIWRWLDAETAIRAFAHIADSRTDVKLVITAGRADNESSARLFDTTAEVRALADSLGVLGRTVLFYDEWIPYEQRHDYLHEADLGLTLHRHADEAWLAARSRYMDYLSAELPCVLGRGDEAAEEFGAAGFATLVENPSPQVLAEQLLALVDDPAALAAAQGAGHRLAAEHSWSAVGAKLRAVVAHADARAPGSRAEQLALIGTAGGYYARRAVDRLVAAD